MKTLVLSWGIPPLITGSSVVVDNFVAAMDIDKYVLVGEKPSTGSYSNSPNVHYLDSIGPSLKGNKYWRLLQLPRLIRQTTQIAQDNNCTQILTIFPDELYMHIGYSVSRKLDLKFYAWFHNTYLENRTGILKFFAKRWQKKFFAQAKTIFTISDGLTEWYKGNYNIDKFVTLNHGFPIPSVTRSNTFNEKGKLKFLFTGNLNHSCLDATERLYQWITNHELGELHIFSGQSKTMFNQYGISGKHVIFHEFMEFEEFVQNFQNFDILLLPHGLKGLRSEEEYQTIFPTRTIPYLCSQRPILAVSPEKAYLTRFLREHECAHISTTGTEASLNELLDEILDDDTKIKDEKIENAMRLRPIFDVHNVVQKFLRHTELT